MVWLTILILLHLFFHSFKFNILLQITSLALFIVFFKPRISLSFVKQISPLIYLFAVGMLGMLIYDYKAFNIIKDILHSLKPIIGLLIGYFFIQELNDEKKFFKLIIIMGLLSAIYHYILVFVMSDLSSGSINAFRLLSQDNYLELISLFFLIYYKKIFGESFIKPIYYWGILAFLSLSVVMYFSRIMMVLAVVFLLNYNGFTRITIRNIKLAGIMLVSILLLYTYLYNVKLKSDAPGLEGFLFKIKMAPGEVFNAKLDKENMMYLGENWRAYEAKRAFDLMNSKPETYVFGNGYGSLVNLGFWAPLGEYKRGMKYISELHNGYMYVFYKTGAIGLTFYFTFLFSLYNIINKDFSFRGKIISGIGIAFLFTSLVFGGLYNYRDIFTFILGGMLYFYYKKNREVRRLNY